MLAGIVAREVDKLQMPPLGVGDGHTVEPHVLPVAGQCVAAAGRMYEGQAFQQLVDRSDHLVGVAHPADAALGRIERSIGGQAGGEEHEDGEAEGDLDLVALEQPFE